MAIRTGPYLDAEGCVWNARVAGGGCLLRFAPERRIDRLVELPCSWPTNCSFGGSEIATLFVSSASFTMTAEHLASAPHEGGLFAFEPGLGGLPEDRSGFRAAI